MALFGLFIAIAMSAADNELDVGVFFTQISDKQVKTLQVKVAGEPLSNPFVELGGERQIEINFDVLGDGVDRYAYNLIHCDANWQRSTLSPIEYMDGFPGSTIDDFANALGTTIPYTNYRLFFPNDDVQPKVSGNYALQVYCEDDPSHIVLTACFSLYERQVSVAAKVSGNTDIDTNRSHQQLSFTVHHKNFPIPYPQSDLKLRIYQNNRRDNVVTTLQPMSILEDQLVYANNKDLIFSAGNEYRRMEFLSNKYNGMRVEGISFHHPYYHVDVMVDQCLDRQSYQYDQDQDGHYLIGCSNCNDPDTEADYYVVHFALAMEEISDGNVYLNGELVNNTLDENSLMIYNPERGQYEKSLLLKQGHYNYQYLFVPNGHTLGYTALTEGDFFQTENEYTIYVYYRPMGARFDRLIGVASVRNETPML